MTDSGVHFRVWAPIRKTVDVVIEDGRPVRSGSRRLGLFLRLGLRAPAQAPVTATGSTAGKLFPIRLPASSPRGRTARQKLSIPRHSSGPTKNGAA